MALELKQQGNEYVAEAKYEQAADLYTQALAVCDDDAAELRGTLLCNRSHCYIELERFEEAMKDASDSIEARPNWFKPHLRLAEAVVAIDPYKALYEWLSAFALDDRCREADVAVSAIQGLIQPHVHARQDLIKQHSLASLLCCPYTGGLLTQPVTLPSGQLVNKTIAQYYTSPHHDHILPVTEQELFDLDSDNSDVTESHVNLMMRNVMEKVAANQVAHNQAVAELDVLGAVDAYYQAREEKDSDGMRSALGKIHKLIPTVLEHWEQEPTSYIAWCMVLLHELQLVDGGSDKPATWPDMPQPKDLLAQVPTSLASLDIVRSVPNRTQPYHADPGLVNLLGACTTLSDDRIRHFARQLVCTYKIDRNASAIPPDELAAKISEFDMTWLGTMDKLPKEEDLEQALRNIPATDFDCQLCFSMVHYPVALPCGHVFCKTCVERFLDHKPSCPVCRLPLPHYLAKRQFEVVAPLHELTRKLYPEELAQRDEERQAELAEMRAWMPVFVCNTALPGVRCPLHIFEPRYRLMLRRVMETESKEFGMCCHTNDGYSDYGTLLKITEYQTTPDGRSYVDCIGTTRFRVTERSIRDDYNVARIEPIVDHAISEEAEAEARAILENKIATIQACVGAAWPRMVQQAGDQPEDVGLLSFWLVGLLGHSTLEEMLLPIEYASDRARLIDQHLPDAALAVSALQTNQCVIS